MGSTRLPGKVLKEVAGTTLLEIHLKRVLQSRAIDELIVATTIQPEDRAIVDLCNRMGIASYQGSVDDVLDRFYQAAKGKNADYLVRITADCPLIDPALIDRVIEYTIKEDLDYCADTFETTFPDGQDIEVMKYSVFQRAWQEAKLASEREHVTPYIWKNSTYKGGSKFISGNYAEGNRSYGHLRMTVDEQRDFALMTSLIEALGTDKSWHEYAEFLEQHPDVRAINETITRNEGYTKSIGKEE